MDRMNIKDLATRTRKDLVEIAKQLKLSGVSRLRKQELLDRISAALSPRANKGTSETATPPPSSTKKRTRTVAKSPRRAIQEAPATLVEQPKAKANEPLATQAPQTEQVAPETLAAQPTFIPVEAPVLEPEQDVQAPADSKFFLGPQPHASVSEPPALPASYNDNRIVLLARDPHWLYAYWDFNGEHFSKVQSQLGTTEAPLVLRVFDVTYVEFNGANAWSSVEVELTPFATNWYVSVPQADAAYCAEIGYRSPDNQFVPLGRSNVVTTPRADESLSTTVRWFTPPERRIMSHDSQPPRSQFAQGHSPKDAAHPSAPVQPAPSSAEHPFSWGTARKL
jgi:hypothetical protein